MEHKGKKTRLGIALLFAEKMYKGRNQKETRSKAQEITRRRSGDIETNPGPEWDIPEIEREQVTRIEIRQRITRAVPDFDIEEFMIEKNNYQELLQDRFHNIVYTCTYGTFTIFTIKYLQNMSNANHIYEFVIDKSKISHPEAIKCCRFGVKSLEFNWSHIYIVQSTVYCIPTWGIHCQYKYIFYSFYSD